MVFVLEQVSHIEDRDLDTEIRAILKEPYLQAGAAKKQVTGYLLYFSGV